jgi:hypothetical protein
LRHPMPASNRLPIEETPKAVVASQLTRNRSLPTVSPTGRHLPCFHHTLAIARLWRAICERPIVIVITSPPLRSRRWIA